MSTEIWYLLFNDEKELLGAPYKAEVRDIADLKKAIKEVAFSYLANVQASDLVVWRCKEPTLLSTQDDDELQDYLLEIDFHNKKQVVKLASGADLADLELGSKEVLLVQVPSTQDQLPLLRTFAKRPRDWLTSNPTTAPSSAGELGNLLKRQVKPEKMIFYGRPYSAFWAIPPTLLCPQFSQFMIDLDSCTPSTHDIELFHELCQQMSDLFVDEYSRNERFVTLMNKYGFSDLSRKLISKYPTDGVFDTYINEVHEHVTYCILEVKNEIGSKNAEPMAQAIFYWLEAIRLCKQDKDNQLFSRTNFPAVLLLHYGESCCFTCLNIYTGFSIGPYISVALAVYTGTTNVQIVNPIIPLHFHPSDTKTRATGERFICALSRLLSSLKNYYLTDAFSKSSRVQVKFPFYTTYTDGGASHPFVYEKQIDGKRVFSAHLRDNPEDKIFVKFSRRYGEDAHKVAHAYGFAPKLRAVERYADGWVMVVMDDVSQQFCAIKDRRLKENVYKAVEKALALLHADGYVHGDVRETNIMVKRDGVDSEDLGDIILVDFDWAGKENTVRYPSNITLGHPELPRPEDVDRGGLISSAHDDKMLELLYP